MRAFVSGGAGFIGSHLVPRLLAQHGTESVVIYDNLSSGSMDHLAASLGDPRLKVIEADVKHLGELTSAMRGSDVVFHLAANPDIAKAARHPDIDFWEGTYLAQNVVEAVRLNRVRRLLYTSGSGVYGENPDAAFAEDYGPCLPISTYGASKLACEALICSYAHMFGFTARAFRFANVVGPRQTHGVGYDFVRHLRQDSSQLRILGDGSQCKSYIHVEDVLDAIFLVNSLLSDAVPFDVFNVASDDYITVNEIAGIAVAESGFDESLIRYVHTGGDRGWKGDVPKVLFNVAKIKTLGWRAARTSEQAIRDSIRAMISELSGGTNGS
ncbi:MAG: NAD-dependent epimerase/dehydratase family protein [Acidiferrobacteraceae bacterium]